MTDANEDGPVVCDYVDPNAHLKAIQARAEECKEAGRYEAAAELYSLLIAILEV